VALSAYHCATEKITTEADTQAPIAPTQAAFPSGQRFQIQVLDCVEEVRILNRAWGGVVNGEKHLTFDTLIGRTSVLVSSEVASDQSIIDAVAGTGMSASSDSVKNTTVAQISRAPLDEIWCRSVARNGESASRGDGQLIGDRDAGASLNAR